MQCSHARCLRARRSQRTLGWTPAATAWPLSRGSHEVAAGCGSLQVGVSVVDLGRIAGWGWTAAPLARSWQLWCLAEAATARRQEWRRGEDADGNPTRIGRSPIYPVPHEIGRGGGWRCQIRWRRPWKGQRQGNRLVRDLGFGSEREREREGQCTWIQFEGFSKLALVLLETVIRIIVYQKLGYPSLSHC